MRIIDSEIADYIEDVHISKYGNFYFFKDFIVSEIEQGTDYNWEAAQGALEATIKHYGENPSICYISNRVNKYSVYAINWYRFFKAEKSINGYAIVSYRKKKWLNTKVEKLFFSSKIERFDNLKDAIIWAKDLNFEKTKNKTDINTYFIF